MQPETNKPEVIIEFRDVVKRFGDLTVLDGVSCCIRRGQITAVIGKSGTGKSVLLKHIIGLLAPDQGMIVFDGVEIAEMSRSVRRQLKSRVGYLFQNNALFDGMTVFENVALPLREKTRLGEGAIRERVMNMLERLEVGGTARQYPAQVSGGMRKRVALARALITEPEIVLFDEPTTGLDPMRRNAVHSMIAHMQRRFGFTAVIVSHEIPEIFYIAQQVLMLDQAKIVFAGSADEIEQSEDVVVRNFITGRDERLSTDTSTGLHNKTAIRQKYEETVVDLDETWNCCILVFRVDAFDELNERVGFVVGQQVMGHLAELVQKQLHIAAENCRYRDDVIVTMLPDSDRGQTASKLAALTEQISQASGLPPQGCPEMTYTVSVGLAEPSATVTLDEAVERALAEMKQLCTFSLT